MNNFINPHITKQIIIGTKSQSRRKLFHNLNLSFKFRSANIDERKVKNINNNKNLSGYLLDGFPRNTEQAKLLDNLMLELKDKISCVIQLDVDEKHLKDRILSRGKEEGRSDDNEETLLKRLETYFSETMPLIKYYDEAKLLKKVSGVGEIMQINQSINTIIDHL